MDTEILTRNAIEKVNFIDKYRGKLLRPLIFDALIEMAESISKIDRTQQLALLSDIGTELAELIDQKFLLTALAKYFQNQKRLHEPYSQLMRELIASTGESNQALNSIFQGNTSLRQAMSTEIKNFVDNTNILAQRIAKDIDAVAKEFANSWQKETEKPTGIIGIEIAGRFSFNGGKRIVVLTLDNHKNLIYKPRDIRIEAKLIGHVGTQSEDISDRNDSNRSFIELINTLLKEELGERFIPIPTYQFLPRHDEHGHYGYVEYLSCGTEADACLTHEQAQKLYLQLGQLTGIALILGLYDLLPSNVRISGKQAYFTDTDIAFESSILKVFLDEMTNIKSLTIPPASLQRSLLTNFWQHSLNSVKPSTLYVVKNDRIIKNPKITSKNNIKVVATENFIFVKNKGSNRNLEPGKELKNINTFYASDVKQGLQSVFSIISKNKHAPKRIKSFITNLAGLQVRYFPFLVLSPLLQRIFTDYIYDYPEPEGLYAKINYEINIILQKKQQNDIKRSSICRENTIALQNVICDSLINGDYIYITQKLGKNKLFYHDNPIIINADAENSDEKEFFFPTCSLSLAKEIIDKLSQKSTQRHIQLFTNCYEIYIQSLVMPPLPPRHAIKQFVNTIGIYLAKQLGKSNNI